MLLWLQNLLGLSGPSAWPVAPNWLIRASARVYSLKGLAMPFAGDFSAVDPPERVPLSIDFSAQIPTGDSLASVTTTMAAYYGTDANASALLYGAPAYSGTVVTQWAGPGWLPGVVYRLTMTAVTAKGATISLYAHTPAQAQT